MFSLLVTFNLSALTTPSTVTLSVTFTSLNEPLAVASTFPVTAKAVPFHLKFPSPSNSPFGPTTTTLLSPKSVTLIDLNEPLAEPLKLPVISCVPVTLRFEPSNVRLAESSISPPPPAITTLSSVKSVTVRDAILASSDIFKSANEADAEPLRFDVISCVPVILNIEPSNVKFADESTPCVPVNVVIWLFTPLPLMIESPFDNNIFFSKSFAPAIQ